MEQPEVNAEAQCGAMRKSVHHVVCCAWIVTIAVACLANTARAQLMPLDRLPGRGLAMYSPDSRVTGAPGEMRIAAANCPARNHAELRRRIVDIAVQEWAFFGFSVVDQTGPPPPPRPRSFYRRPWMDPAESQRVAASIAGYWSVTPDGGWILERQNDYWNGPLGVGERWRDPWSAAFISWTMCEAGVGDLSEFRRSINHRTYIDQAIRARDTDSRSTAYVAYDIGEREIAPGDLLCSAGRHGYRTLQDRRNHLGEGARTHCDIVVHVDSEQDRILAIGGNVRGRVSLKLLYALQDTTDPDLHSVVGRGRRTVFAHLRLTAETRDDIGLLSSPSVGEIAGDRDRRVALERLLAIGLPDPDDS